MDEKKTYTCVIAGLPLKLKSSLPEAQVAAMVQLVDQSVAEVMRSSRSIPLQNAVILAALNIAELFFHEKSQNEQLRQERMSLLSRLREEIRQMQIETRQLLQHVEAQDKDPEHASGDADVSSSVTTD